MTSSTDREVMAAVDRPSELVAGRPDQVASAPASPLRVAVVVMSVDSICGVRDHAFLLADALEDERTTCTRHWLVRDHLSLRGSRTEIGSWTQRLRAELEESRPDVAVLHYSVFSHTYRGVPLFVHPMLAALRRARVPVVAFFHELAYPWRRGGWRGAVWALSQRAALIEVIATARAAMVTEDLQARWLASRRWLPSRPLAVAPVFSNLPPPTGSKRPSGGGPVIGIFGYSYEGIDRPLVLDALRILRREAEAVSLKLLGAPGRDSESAERWLELAGERDLAGALAFSGPLPAQPLSEELAACDLLVFADSGGPSSRKGSLAAALALGCPVVAIDGRNTWPELVREDVVRVVPPSARELAQAIVTLIRDRAAASALGARGRAFHEQRMGVDVTARAFRALVGQLPRRAG